MNNVYTITETGKAEVLSMVYCPICGATVEGDIRTWDCCGDFQKAPLTCKHGFVLTENRNTTDDAALDDWQSSVVIWSEYIHELKALGYREF